MPLIRRSGMWRQVSPTGAIDDFITVFRNAGPNRWRFAALALLPPIGIVYMFMQEEVRGKPPPPKIDYITTFASGRTQAEIIASNIANQRRKDRLAAEQAKREEDVRRMYETLGRLSGMDVDAIKRKADAERAAEAQAQAAKEAALKANQQRAETAPQ